MQKQGDQDFHMTFKARAGRPIAGQSFASRVTKFGIKPKQLGDDISKKIAGFPGIKVHTSIPIANKKANIEIVPSTSHLLKDILRTKGSISKKDILDVIGKMKNKLNSKTKEGNILQVLGTCVSLETAIDGIKAKEMIKKFKNGEIAF